MSCDSNKHIQTIDIFNALEPVILARKFPFLNMQYPVDSRVCP